MLEYLTKKDLRTVLKMVDTSHRNSLQYGISVLKKLDYNRAVRNDLHIHTHEIYSAIEGGRTRCMAHRPDKTYMEIHVHSTLAMKEVGRKRKATQTNKTYNTQTRQTGHTGHRFHQPYKKRQTNSHKYNMQHTKVNTGQKTIN